MATWYVIVWPDEDADEEDAFAVLATGTFRSEEDAELFLASRPVLRAAGAKIVPLTPL